MLILSNLLTNYACSYLWGKRIIQCVSEIILAIFVRDSTQITVQSTKKNLSLEA